MTQKLSFIEEAQIKGFKYRPGGILGNGFYGNGMFVSLTEMEKKTKIGAQIEKRPDDQKRIDGDFFIDCETLEDFYTSDLLRLYPDLKEHQLHNFLNRYKEVFLSQKLFTIVNRKRVFSKEAVRFIYRKLIKKEEPVVKKRGRRSIRNENN